MSDIIDLSYNPITKKQKAEDLKEGDVITFASAGCFCCWVLLLLF